MKITSVGINLSYLEGTVLYDLLMDILAHKVVIDYGKDLAIGKWVKEKYRRDAIRRILGKLEGPFD